MQKFPIAAALLMAATFPAVAAGKVAPNKQVLEAQFDAGCTILIGPGGVMAPNGRLSILSSRNPGGRPAEVRIITTAPGFAVRTQAPAAFTVTPPGFDGAAAFSTDYTASGVTSVSEIPGSRTTILGLGTTNLSINLTASKSFGLFLGGEYQADLAVICQ